MRLTRVRLRDFRNYERAEFELRSHVVPEVAEGDAAYDHGELHVQPDRHHEVDEAAVLATGLDQPRT